jgi:signal transduction histidine kinase
MTGVKTLQGELTLMLTVFNAPDARGRSDSMAIIGVDISELRRRERENERLREQLINVGKMKAIGQLAGGIAHDFNNLLGAMYGFASFLDEDLEQRPQDRQHATRILTLLDHAKTLVSQILTFARADRVEREPIEVSRVVRGTVTLLKSSLPPCAQLTLDITDDEVWLNANEGQIRQLLINLTMNCAEAFDGQEGTIVVRLDRFVAGHPELERVIPPEVNRYAVGTLLDGEDYVRITVSDDGQGMQQATLERLMEPFFAIPSSVDRHGLGLSIVHAIVTSSGGAYVVTSRLGHGTSFEIYFPVNEDEALVALPAGGERLYRAHA